MSSQSKSRCKCERLTYESSSYAAAVGYERLNAEQRVVAAGQKASSAAPDPRVFPAPLVLPTDDLAWEPDYEPQDINEWTDLVDSYRKHIAKRKVIYIAAPPVIEPEVRYMSSWSDIQGHRKVPQNGSVAMEDVVDYIAAFYHGMPVRLLPSTFRYMAWEEDVQKKKKKQPKQKSRANVADPESQFIGLSNGKESVRITTRTSKDGVFKRQLNLNDILDSVIGMLPADAHSVMLLVNEDIYESEEDDFACGRAYGGSHVAVISMARYNPSVDKDNGCETQHAWPASHCEKFVKESCIDSETENQPRPKKRKGQKTKGRKETSTSDAGYPVRAALEAYLPMLSPTTGLPIEPSRSLWLGRVCRTVSHELGHCFGIDHCVYYACCMQSTACLAEDVRQPPYLCPVDLEKVLRILNVTMKSRYEALIDFCNKHNGVSLFAAYGAWIKARMKLLELHQPAENEIIWISP